MEFADSIAASLLMYLPETIALCLNRVLHARLLEAANIIFVLDGDNIIMDFFWFGLQKLEFGLLWIISFSSKPLWHWNTFLLAVLKNILWACIPFEGILDRMVGGFRGVHMKWTQLRENVSTLGNKNQHLIDICESQSKLKACKLTPLFIKNILDTPSLPY